VNGRKIAPCGTVSTVWREPGEESTGLYPGLVVHDGRMSGSITAGRSRMPLWAFVGLLPDGGWDTVLDSYPETHGLDADAMAAFLRHLMEMRGEFGRLLLTLADVERLDELRQEGYPYAPPWWEQPESRDRVVGQLRRCLAALEGER
jgi:hypothetical protein